MSKQYRIGQGVDVHRLAEGRSLIIGGVNVPFDRGLDGHSDADVLVHAIIDALLGACGEGDIGTRFPNTDPRWHRVDSLKLLAEVWSDLRSKGWKLSNLDSSIVAERPMLSHHIPQMKRRIAEVLGVDHDAVGIKAGTAEKLGALGREEGIVAFAAALLFREVRSQ